MTRLSRVFAALRRRRSAEAPAAVEWPPPIGACVRARRGPELMVMARYQDPASGEYAIVRAKTENGADYEPLTRDDWTSGGYRIVR